MAILKETNERLRNWSGNLEYSSKNFHCPNTIEEVRQIVNQCQKITALGSRHSFSRIADNHENQISLENLNKIVSINRESLTVTVEAGMRYGELAGYLQQNGYALHNLASLPHINIAGAVSTATHGSGLTNGNLSTAVSAIEFVNADGESVTLSKQNDGELFNAVVVGLGAFGIITKITLDIEPTFDMKQVVYCNLPMKELENNFTAIMSSGYSVSLFTDWQNKNIKEVWIKSRVDDDTTTANSEFYGAKPADRNLHPIETESAEKCTEQMGVAAPWFEIMPHFKLEFTPSSGRELQSEYFVPIEYAYEAMTALEELREQILPYILISEIRTIKADDLWMSPCYRQTCAAFHTTWKQEVNAVMNLLPLIEEKLSPFNAQPHFAKLFTMSPKVIQSRYKKFNEFRDLINEYDPKGKFRNEFLEKIFTSGN